MQGLEAEGQALLLHGLQHGFAGAAPAAFVEERLELGVAGRRLDGQGVLRGHGQVGHAHERVRAGGEDAERRGALGDLEMRLDALGAADPVALHGADRLGPALEPIEPGEQLLGVIGDPEEPLRDQAPLDRSTRAPALAVDDLLVGEHGLIDRVPVDQRGLLVDEALPEQLQKKPLLPAVIFRPAGRELAAPVVAEAQALELGAHVLDVGVGPLGGRDAVLDGGVLGRQPEGVPAHGLQDVPAPHALVARDHIPDGVVADVPHVELPARIGEHRKAVELLAPRVLGGAEYPRLLPAALDGGLDVLWAIGWCHGRPRSRGEDNPPDYGREGPCGPIDEVSPPVCPPRPQDSPLGRDLDPREGIDPAPNGSPTDLSRTTPVQLHLLGVCLNIKGLDPSNEGNTMRVIAEPVARKKRKGARGLFANSPLNFLDLGDPTQIIELIRKGLPAQAIDFVADLLSLSRAAFLASIKIPASTMERRLRTGEALTSEESDRVSRVAKVLRRAVEVFGDDAQGKAWMIDPVSSLGGRTPLSLLDTMEGYELVTNTLSRIEYGVYG